MDKRLYRVIDANLNRAREAIRVSEDTVRFILDSAPLTRELKAIRHGIASLITTMPNYKSEVIAMREASSDVGRSTSLSERKRRDCADIVVANLERAKEALRVLEEFFKLFDTKKAEGFKSLRYSLYAVEKKIAARMVALSRAR